MTAPSMDAWLAEARADADAPLCGMYLFHNGTVRQTPKAQVRMGAETDARVTGMRFDYDPDRVEAAVCAARRMPGIYYVRVWLNRGVLNLGDSIMMVLIGGDIRPRVVDALQALVENLKTKCVVENEITL